MSEKIKITFLGTSGAFPTKKRNHPGFLLTYKGKNILIDCGEGTQRQLRKANISPCKIDKILITHWHGDHVLGIPGLLQTLSLNNYNKTLQIFGPKNIKTHIKNLLKTFPSYTNVKIQVKEISGKFLETDEFYIKTEKMTHGTPNNAYCFVKKGKIKIDKSKLKKHKIPSGKHLKTLKQGKDLKYKGKKYKAKNLAFKEDDKKICFVMDTSLNKKIKSFVKDSDLLVIESTFKQGEEKLAKERKHLTLKQVLDIAKKSKAKKLALVHISDRYENKFGELLKYAKKDFKNTIIPKDLEVVEI